MFSQESYCIQSHRICYFASVTWTLKSCPFRLTHFKLKRINAGLKLWKHEVLPCSAQVHDNFIRWLGWLWTRGAKYDPCGFYEWLSASSHVHLTHRQSSSECATLCKHMLNYASILDSVHLLLIGVDKQGCSETVVFGFGLSKLNLFFVHALSLSAAYGRGCQNHQPKECLPFAARRVRHPLLYEARATGLSFIGPTVKA